MKINIILLIILSLIIISSSGQNINGYKYIYVPELKYENGSDIYGVSSHLRAKLKQIGFIVIDVKNPPEEVISNKCLLLNCVVNTTQNKFYNKYIK